MSSGLELVEMPDSKRTGTERSERETKEWSRERKE